MVFYFISREFLNQYYSLLISITFAFGTTLWSVASRALWMHGPSILFLELGLLGILYSKKYPEWIPLVGIPLAVAYIIRPTNSISLIIISLYIAYTYREYFIPYCMVLIGTLIPFFILNIDIYGNLLPPYYMAERLNNLSWVFFEALAGNLISPARGLLIYSPILLLCIWGITIKLRNRSFSPLDLSLAAIILLHWLTISLFPHWWAGHSFGPRFFSDMLPYLMYFLFPIFSSIQNKKLHCFYTVIIIVLIALSIYINLKGALYPSTWDWNTNPLNVDEYPSRLWDWTDIQFLR